MNKQEIIIVEDEPKIARLLSDYLSDAGYDTLILEQGTHAVETVSNRKPACVILDLMLPGKDGLEICKQIRQFSELPIVMITARVDEIDRLLGLELGADDYICKPFSPREVVVRIRNILRRVANTESIQQSAEAPDGQISYRELELDIPRFRCTLNGSPVELTAVEFRMLSAMAKRPGYIYSRNQLMDNAYTDARIVSDRTIDTHIKNLRRKMGDTPDNGLIHSIYGLGYKLE